MLEVPLDLALWEEGGETSFLDHLLLDVVGGQHAGLACALNSSRHPATVNRIHLKDQISLGEAHLVGVLRFVVVDSTIDSLEWKGKRMESERPRGGEGVSRLTTLPIDFGWAWWPLLY
jgi:hypothetical protein